MSTLSVTTIQDGAGAGHLAAGGFLKADPDSVAFTKTGNDTAQIKAGTTVAFSDGSQVNFDTATAITMPTLTAGTDYVLAVFTMHRVVTHHSALTLAMEAPRLKSTSLVSMTLNGNLLL